MLERYETVARRNDDVIAGHADIVRESVDGATAFPIMAAAEGWPSTPWLLPWQPAAS